MTSVRLRRWCENSIRRFTRTSRSRSMPPQRTRSASSSHAHTHSSFQRVGRGASLPPRSHSCVVRGAGPGRRYYEGRIHVCPLSGCDSVVVSIIILSSFLGVLQRQGLGVSLLLEYFIYGKICFCVLMFTRVRKRHEFWNVFLSPPGYIYVPSSPYICVYLYVISRDVIDTGGSVCSVVGWSFYWLN